MGSAVELEMISIRRLAFPLLAACILGLSASVAEGQVFTLSKQELTDYTSQNPFERFLDGRPKVPDEIIDRARGFNKQFVNGFEIVHAGKNLVGRAFTVQFMPLRSDVDDVAEAKAKGRGITRLTNQAAIDMVQPGDVLVVDLFGKKVNGTIVGDNLFYYLAKAAHAAGLVVDGSIRDLDGISEIEMPAYYRHADPTPIGNVMLTGINIPIRIGNTTVMPGDLVVGDREGVYFVPPQFVKSVLDQADEIHIHDEWTKKKFAEGKYKSSEIYPSPSDPSCSKNIREYLKKELEEIAKKRKAQ